MPSPSQSPHTQMWKQWRRDGWSEILLILRTHRKTMLFPHYCAMIRSVLRPGWFEIIQCLIRSCVNRGGSCLHLMQTGFSKSKACLIHSPICLFVCVFIIKSLLFLYNNKNLENIFTRARSWWHLLRNFSEKYLCLKKNHTLCDNILFLMIFFFCSVGQGFTQKSTTVNNNQFFSSLLALLCNPLTQHSHNFVPDQLLY